MFKTLARSTVVALVTTLVVTTVALAGYPNPLPDFAHPNSPHFKLLSPYGGNLDRPVLVVYAEFNDRKFQQGQDAAWLAGRYFGPFPSLRNYYSTSSSGKLVFTPAPETQGTANDGIVQVSIAQNHDKPLGFDAKSAADQNKELIQAADPFVNFAQFDANNDGKIDREELIINVIKALPGNNCGANFPVSAVTLDGKALDYAVNSVALMGSDANLITIIHENSHSSLQAIDLYTIGVGQLDLMGGVQCSGGDTRLWELNSWHKMHLGWITPTIVTSDGYYNVGRYDSTGAAFLLYDPSKNTDNYFLVENRERTPNTYDQTVGDQGLLIWRVDDSKFNTNNKWIEVMRPDGASNVTDDGKDAWDPSDANTPERTMSRTWLDGSASHIAVRAMPDRGDVMRVYFDVPGPGVLVDTYTKMKQGPIFMTLGDARSISFPVMNTGDATDTFAFTITVPVGFSATTDTQTLTATQSSGANVDMTPGLNVATGQYLVNATGHSINDPNVNSSSPLQIWVIKRESVVTYIGDAADDYHDSATLSAKLTDKETGDPIAGETVTFTLGSQQATAVTDQFGIANTSLVLTQTPGASTVKTDYAGNSVYFPATDSDAFTITREETTTTYTGPTVILQGASGVTLQARLLEDGTTAPVPAGQTLTLSLGAQSCNAIASNTGLASCSFTYTGALGPQPIGATFAGDTYYEPSSDTGKTALVFAFPSSGAFLLGDDTVATAGPSTLVTWWDSNWSSLVAFSSGDSPAAFKGYASTVVTLPTTTPPASCSGTWSTTSGSSAPPTSGVPSYMGVLVTPSVGKSGSTISGTYSGIVVVATDAGYAPSAGHSGTGHIVATFC